MASTPPAIIDGQGTGRAAAIARRDRPDPGPAWLPLVSSWAGLAAGLTFAFLPQVSWFAENAREGAVLTAFGCVASYCLLRALTEDVTRGRWLVAYGVTLVALGLGNLFALLLVVAHAVTLAWSRREYRVDRGFVRRWAAAVAATLILVSPVAVVGYSQLHQIGWIKPPSVSSLLSVERLVGDPLLFLLVLAIVACAVVASTGLASPGSASTGLTVDRGGRFTGRPGCSAWRCPGCSCRQPSC